MFLYRAGLNLNDDKMTRTAMSQDLKAILTWPKTLDWTSFLYVYLCICVTKHIPGTELLRPLQYLQSRPVPEGFQRRVILCHGHVWWTGSDHAMKQVMKVMEIDAWKELLRYEHDEVQLFCNCSCLLQLKSSAGGHLAFDLVPLLQYSTVDCW